MDVLHVIHQFPPESRGGSESYLLDIAQRQRARGLDAQVLTGSLHARSDVTLDPVEDVEGVPVYRLHRNDLYFDHHAKMWHPEVEELIERKLREWRPALLHVHHWVRLTCNLAEIATRLDIPVVLTLHDYFTSCPRAFRRRLGNAIEDLSCKRVLSADSCASCVPVYGHEPERELIAGVELFADHFRAEVALARTALVAVSSTADLLSEMTGMPRERYETLPLGYHPRFAGLPQLPDPQPAAPLRFCYWGTIGRHKGVDVLLHAFRQVHEQRPGRSELHVLGEPSSPKFEAELQPLTEGLPVTMHGAFDAEKLHGARPDVGIFPSTCLETYGLVLDECFELGRPCITSDLGAVAERGEVAGLTSRAGDASDLAAKMLRFLDEPELWQQLAGRVPPLAMGRQEHVDRLLAIYDRAKETPAPSPHYPPVTAMARIMFLQLQRETSLDKIRDQEGPV